MKRLKRLLTRPSFLGFLGFLVLLVSWLRVPEVVGRAAWEGLRLSAQVLIPSLFPFFVLANLFIRRRYHQYVSAALSPVMGPLFGVDAAGAGALVLGSVGGYPIGAASAVGLYDDGSLSADQTSRLLAFCNNAGPGFIFGVVGAGVFHSVGAGVQLYLIHLLSAALVGIGAAFWRGERLSQRSGSIPVREPEETFPVSLVGAVRDGAAAMVNVCAFLVFFSVMIAYLKTTPVFSIPVRLLQLLPGVDGQIAGAAVDGVLELSTGITGLSGQAEQAVLLPLCAFLLGWGGLCVHCQVLSICGDRPIAMGPYFRGKFAQGLLSAALCIIWEHSLLLCAAVLAVCLLASLAANALTKKRTGKRRTGPV